MTVEEYVNSTPSLEEFYCVSDSILICEYRKYYKYEGEWKRKKRLELAQHQPVNLCHLPQSNWKSYKSHKRFADREVTSVIGNTIYCHWDKEDLIHEFYMLFPHCEIQTIEYKNIKDFLND